MADMNENQEGVSQPTPRLMIKKLVMENFKSYGGIKEIGPFHKCFSSVIGPNGSGKSNVIDAMLFVFGRRANAIRLKKLSELIHTSALLPNCERCSVSVHFCDIIDHPNDADGYDIVPGSEFVVTRTVDRSSTSKYYLDDSPVSMNEIITLLKSKGIDLDHNRFLILQGEVEQIAMMKPKQQQPGGEEGLLEYLEDIIGSNRFIPAINQANEEVSTLNQLREEKVVRAKLAEKEKQVLESGKDNAIHYLKYSLSHLEKQAQCVQIKKHLCEEELKELEGQLTVQLEKYEQEDALLHDLREEYNTVKSAYNVLVNTITTKNKELNTKKEEFNALDRKDANIRDRLQNTQTKLAQAMKEISSKKAELDTLEENVAVDEKNLPKLKQEVTELEAKRVELEQRIQELFTSVRTNTEQVRAQVEAATSKLVPLKSNVNQHAKERMRLENELLLLRQKLGMRSQDMNSMQNELAQVTKDLTEKKHKVDMHKKQVQTLVQHRQELQTSLQSTAAEIQGLNQEQAKYQAEIALVRERASSTQSRNVIARELEKMKKVDKAFQGVYGCLGDLGTIDEQFDLAISMSTPQLRNIVVDNSRTAQLCIEVLRKHNLGRATFICLDKLQRFEQYMRAPYNAPPNGQRLFDLITPSRPEFAVAFYSVVRNTLVAQNLTIANNIAFNGNSRNRVVTLHGEVIDVSGTMSGGGAGLITGLMRLSSRNNPNNPNNASSKAQQKEVDELNEREIEQKLEHVNVKVRDLEHRKTQDISELKEVGLKIRQLEQDIQYLEQSITTLESKKHTLETDINDFEAQSKKNAELKAKIPDLEKQINQAKLAEDDAKSACEDLEQELKTLKETMLSKGGSELAKDKAKSDELQKKIASKKKEMMRLEVNIDNFASKKEHIEDIIAQNEEHVQKLQAVEVELNAQVTEIEEEALQCMQQHDVIQSELQTLVTEQGLKKTNLEQIHQKLMHAENKLQDLKARVDTLQAQVKQGQADAETYGKSYTNLLEEHDKACRELLSALEENSLIEIYEAVRDAELKDNVERKVKMALKLVDQKIQEEDIDGETARVMRQEAETKATEEAHALTAQLLHELPEEEIAAYEEEKKKNEEAFFEEYAFKPLPEDDLHGGHIKKLESAMRHLEQRKGNIDVNLTCISEYRKKHKECNVRHIQLDSITKQRNDAKEYYDNLRKQRLDEFMLGFSVISLKLKEMYQMLTIGGDAELDLQDSVDPFAEGIIFSVRPPRKSWKQIQNLSGGEKTLSSLALVFALHHYKPTPLYVMDEIDAALDFKNVSIVANYIKERTKNAQFIIISLRNNMFELADRLVGIYKTHNITKSVAIDPRMYEVKN